MKNLLFICAAIMCIFSCDDIDNLDRIEGMGPIVEEALEVDDFTGVDLDAPFKVTLTQGDDFVVMAKGHQNIIDRLKTKVNNDKLEIKLENGNYKDFEMELFITMPDLDYLSIDGAGKYKVGEFDIAKLRCYVDGAGKLDFDEPLIVDGEFRIDIDGATDTYVQDVTAENVRVHVDGIGDITLRGKTPDLEIHIDGLGDVEAFALECKNVDVYVNGLGKTEVRATEELNVDIDGIGNVYYKGEPNINKDIDGLGRLYDAN